MGPLGSGSCSSIFAWSEPARLTNAALTPSIQELVVPSISKRPNLYRTSSAARYCGVNAQTMRSYADKRLIPSSRDVDGNRVFRRSDLVAFVSKRNARLGK